MAQQAETTSTGSPTGIRPFHFKASDTGKDEGGVYPWRVWVDQRTGERHLPDGRRE